MKIYAMKEMDGKRMDGVTYFASIQAIVNHLKGIDGITDTYTHYPSDIKDQDTYKLDVDNIKRDTDNGKARGYYDSVFVTIDIAGLWTAERQYIISEVNVRE